MTDPLDAKIIFLAALERTAEDRVDYLDAACGVDAALRQRVEALLAADARSTTFPGARTLGRAQPPPAEDEAAGIVIDHYELVECLGEGGFGTVWLAKQREPVRRDVALKVVKRGMDSRAIVARFSQERQALAVMDHPNISRILDGGTTRAGRPYFAMELVPGVPITQYCDEQRLDPEARLRLFVPVCHALQHAHQKGVVHRDIKPSNVLVARSDAGAVPKVIDFGIAKALHQPLCDGTLLTELHQMIGTPAYMAPEQAEQSTDIDTRADVYSLGVLLYELLTGTVPFDTRVIGERGLPDILRMICEDVPPKPSTRSSTPGPACECAAQLRRTDAARLGHRLRGDLDWIVMKALEKDRSRRYATAQELATDIERHLAHEPVLASPPSFVYRARKLVRRYRGRFAAVAAVLLALVAGIIGTTWFAIAAARFAAEATAGRKQFDQLATSVLLERASVEEASLYRLPPDEVPALQAWLRSYDGLPPRREGIERTILELRERALPVTAAELRADHEHHPMLAAWEAMGKDLESERRAQAVREGAAKVDPPLPAELANKQAMELAQHARDRLAPRGHERKVHGEDDLALTMARAAVATPESPMAPRYLLLSTLALALFHNGHDQDALAMLRQVVDLAPAHERGKFEKDLRELEERIDGLAGDGGRTALRRLELEFAELTAEVYERQTYHFADPAQLFLYETLCENLVKLDRMQLGARLQVERRLTWATRMAELTEAHPGARVSWADAIAAVRDPAGPYGQHPIDLAPQFGLVPIGRNPVTGLWEFYDLRSAWDGEADPSEIAVPQHDEQGRIQVGDDTGIVFVLLPGGQTTVGAQSATPDGPNYDPDAGASMGPVRTLQLQPYFVARHELTQGQWLRLWAGDAHMREPSRLKAGLILFSSVPLKNSLVTHANPVENVDWFACDWLLRLHGLQLPTTAQWEHACRAGTTTTWSCAESELVDHANLSDATPEAAGTGWAKYMPWDDGCASHAGVGWFAPNRFGLHDMHGNVWEWCSDSFSEFTDSEGRPRPGDACRGVRGGSFMTSAGDARSAFHRWPAPVLRLPDLGVRAVREVRP
jgi:serine/threonine protein kinase/formylglycine-generating enzyme required for sulfatase activity